MDPPNQGAGRRTTERRGQPARRNPSLHDSSPPDFDRIAEHDLRDDARLRLLYIEAVRRRYWPNSPQAALEFICYAEKALLDDTFDTPGKLFYALVKRKDGATVSQATENRAMQRFPSHLRQELVEAATTAAAPERAPEARGSSGDVEEALVGRDIGYAHAVMLKLLGVPRLDEGEWSSRRFGMNWKHTAKTTLVQMLHKVETFEHLNKHLVLVLQDKLLDYMRRNFAFGHLRPRASVGDAMHIHSYLVEKRADSTYRLMLHDRLSTDAEGIAVGLGLHVDPRVEISRIESVLLQKIGPNTLFTPA